jgi:hypothetical protein
MMTPEFSTLTFFHFLRTELARIERRVAGVASRQISSGLFSCGGWTAVAGCKLDGRGVETDDDAGRAVDVVMVGSFHECLPVKVIATAKPTRDSTANAIRGRPILRLDASTCVKRGASISAISFAVFSRLSFL